MHNYNHREMPTDMLIAAIHISNNTETVAAARTSSSRSDPEMHSRQKHTQTKCHKYNKAPAMPQSGKCPTSRLNPIPIVPRVPRCAEHTPPTGRRRYARRWIPHCSQSADLAGMGIALGPACASPWLTRGTPPIHTLRTSRPPGPRPD